ncbi:tRNA guanosine-2'-O-methyltransferase TRM13 like protein [Gryllus bimaculatus]|nr:tRNA guanosine-2'-O-methyltransferase TRM13 like protein [Gryllus bimaculatus]
MSSASDERSDETSEDRSEESAEQNENEPKSGQCNFFVARKKRFCKMTVRKGEKFCGEHRNPDVFKENDLVIRVPCPLDNKHTCYAHLLKKHMKKCNARCLNQPDYVMKNINRGMNPCETSVKVTLSSVENDVITQLIKKIKLAVVPAVKTDICNHPVLSEELSNDQYGASTRKHLLQNSSLLGHLSNLGVLNPETCFIEFGAGRGQLSYWIGEAMSQQGMPCLLVPVDRANNRHKFDSRHRNEDAVKILRLRVDIADLCLARVPEIKDSGSIVAICKHLCGDATDLALRCLASSNLSNISGIIMAPCCHHRIDWNTYVGQEFLQDHNFSVEDFQLMSSLASWATCGQSNFNRGKECKPTDRLAGLNVSPQECEDIGRRCKLLFDCGRLRYLEKFGYKCKMVYYTDKNVSPENVCLIASSNPLDIDFLNLF